MKPGSKEWFEKVNENYEFPNVFVFYYASNKEILSGTVDTKSENVGNIKYNKVRPPVMVDGRKVALLGVHVVNSAEEYYSITQEYGKHFKEEGPNEL